MPSSLDGSCPGQQSALNAFRKEDEAFYDFSVACASAVWEVLLQGTFLLRVAHILA